MRPITKITVFGFRLGLVLLALYWLAIFVGTHLPGALAVGPNVNDKVKHFVAFFALGGLLCYVTNSPRWVPRFVSIGLAGMAYAAIDEWTQQLVPGRFSDWADFIADSLGLWSAIGIYVTAKWVYLRVVAPPAVAAQNAVKVTRSNVGEHSMLAAEAREDRHR
jgi:VanZ family protein